MTIATWGTFTREIELREILASYLAARGIVGEWSLKLQHLPSGFTDNVFLVTATGSQGIAPVQLILKEYTETWHKKEATFYGNVLSSHPSLGAPRKLLEHDNWLLLEYLAPKDFRLATGLDLPLLTEWLVAKHRAFLHKLPQAYAETLDIQQHYLIDKPVEALRLAAKSDAYKQTATKILATIAILPDLLVKHIALPQTLEHGDLEMQNILVTRSGESRLRLIDWVNARRGSGLFDINQLLENVKTCTPDVDTKKLVNDIGQQLEIVDLATLLNENRLLMILNKLNFYLSKKQEGYDRSAANGQAIHDHITNLMSEYCNIVENRHA